jgi:HlyD family secretion protein
LNQAQTECQRNEKLFQEGYISEMTLLAKKTDVETATAALKSAEAGLKRAQTNLKYAEIRSPITGTVIERSVDAGQTIAASMNAPTLFTIAEDLAHMQIEANVDETDIGQIKEGMAVQFTVQAYPDEQFTGTVRQIRLKPTTSEDVVNYTVVVDAMNAQGLLLPGMTATVNFIVAERQNVLLVPNTALSFQPSQEMLATLQPQSQQSPSNEQARVYYLDAAGNLEIARFVPGTTDGAKTEILQSAQLHEGTRIIIGVNTAKKNTTTSSTTALPIPGIGGPPPGGAGGPPPP